MTSPGRPLLLDEFKKQQICAVIRAGAPLETAARYVGCHPRTIHRTTQADRDFARRLAKAFAGQEIEQVHALVAHSKKSWRAAAWYLERRRRGYRRVNDRHVDPEPLAAFARLISDAMFEFIEHPEQRSAASARVQALAAQWLERERGADGEPGGAVSLEDEQSEDERCNDERSVEGDEPLTASPSPSGDDRLGTGDSERGTVE